jgi:cytidine deaminase
MEPTRATPAPLAVLRNAGFCAERHAIADVAYREGPQGWVTAIIVASPVPSSRAPVTMPCGICRHVIHELSAPDATVLCASYILREAGILPFPQLRRFSVADLYPHPYEPIVWEEWVDVQGASDRRRTA